MSYHYEHERPNHERKFPKGKHAPLPALAADLWPMFDAYLTSRGLDSVTARGNRWYPSRSARDTQPRIVIPGTNSAGLSYWQARAMVPDPKRYQSPMVQRGDSIIVVWPLPDETVGHVSASIPLVVAEGPMDALAAASSGFIGLSVMGSRPPEEVLDFVAGYLSRRAIIVAADTDFPADAARIMAYLAAKGRKCTLLQPTSKDLAAMPVKARDVLLRKCESRLLSRSV